MNQPTALIDGGLYQQNTIRKLAQKILEQKSVRLLQWTILVLVIGGRKLYNPLVGNIYLVYKRYILPTG